MAGSPLGGEVPVEGRRPGQALCEEEDAEEDLLGTRSHRYTGGSEQGFALAQPRLSHPRSSCSQQTFPKTRSLGEGLLGSLASQGAPRASSWARLGRCSPPFVTRSLPPPRLCKDSVSLVFLISLCNVETEPQGGQLSGSWEVAGPAFLCPEPRISGAMQDQPKPLQQRRPGGDRRLQGAAGGAEHLLPRTP